MITITLNIKGKEKKFTARGVTLRASYDAYRIYREYEAARGDYSDELLERIEELIVRIFGGAFSAEELRDCYMGSAFRLYPGMLNAIVGYSNEAMINFPEPAGAMSDQAI